MSSTKGEAELGPFRLLFATNRSWANTVEHSAKKNARFRVMAPFPSPRGPPPSVRKAHDNTIKAPRRGMETYGGHKQQHEKRIDRLITAAARKAQQASSTAPTRQAVFNYLAGKGLCNGACGGQRQRRQAMCAPA